MRARADLAAPRPAFYALRGGPVGDFLTLLHPPYTAWHLSYFAIGAALAPHMYVNRLLWGLAAFALAVGVAAHALDELHGRPLRTAIPDRALVALACVALAGAVAIGVYGAVIVSASLIPFVLVGALFLPAYNLELARSRFHGELSFALGWGAFPALTGYFVEAERITVASVLIAAACAVISLAQRQLSLAARDLRRRTAAISGTRTLSDGSVEQLSLAKLLTPFDRALALLSVAMVLTACALVAARL